MRPNRKILMAVIIAALLCTGVFRDLHPSALADSPSPGGYYDGFITEYARDHALSARFAREISALVSVVARAEVPETTGVQADIFIKRGRYPSDTAYSLEIKEPVRLHISFCGERVSAAEFVDRCVTVRDAVLAGGFRVEHFRFDYRWGINENGFGLDMEAAELFASPQHFLARECVYRVHHYGADGGEK